MADKGATVRLLGKKAIVTGAARGIGRGCALELARAGADVVVNDLDHSPEAESVVAEIRKMGRRAELVEGDVFDARSCERVVERAIEAFGRLDILVSNPALTVREDFLEYDPEVFQKVVQGVLVGGFLMSRLVARRMAEQGDGGKIIFISSVHAQQPYARSVAYNAGKAGLNQMAKTIAAELVGHRINVNVIEPGWIDTPGERAFFSEEVIRRESAKLPWGRMGRPDEIGKAAAFLASDDADYITGAILPVDGGFLLRDAIARDD